MSNNTCTPPKQTASNQTASNQTASNQTASNQTASNQTASNASGIVTDPVRDGNIEAEAFTVASDPRKDHERAAMAYKTLIDDRVSFAEIHFEEGSWGAPMEIDVYSDTVPGHKFAMVYDPDPVKTNKRHLFFTEEDGDGYVYMQSYSPTGAKWKHPQKLAFKAHRFSGFAATFTTIAKTDHVILLYFINESNELVEYTGKYLKTSSSYKWKNTATIAQGLQIRGAISAIQMNDKTYVTYRGATKGVDLQVGESRKPLTGEKSQDAGEASWKKFNLRAKGDIAKDTPLAIAINAIVDASNDLVLFYLQRLSHTTTIFALEFSSRSPGDDKKPVAVGKLEPDSNLGAASMKVADKNKPAVRLLSVSKLDGDDVVLERVRREVKGTGAALASRWVISGGVVATDVSHIAASRPKDDEKVDEKVDEWE